ncbi:hypothetical protein Arad_8166 [Rhizobium rhizogenes K84]|uniref:Uncharacterized protein n=1 Tax=Rhizobium rhizogenes (strain K84 / ATCC BAA-868) TaxID=311403 RepID=B9JHW0_RHIR8|nr:hypothetical protein Arad_8166 [Rhizobium rhizogenes K84]
MKFAAVGVPDGRDARTMRVETGWLAMRMFPRVDFCF